MQAFGDILHSKETKFVSDIQLAREGLEKLNLDSFAIQDSVSAIVYIQDVVTKEPMWTSEFRKFEASDKLLRKQRFAYPSNWISIDYLHSELVFFQN